MSARWRRAIAYEPRSHVHAPLSVVWGVAGLTTHVRSVRKGRRGTGPTNTPSSRPYPRKLWDRSHNGEEVRSNEPHVRIVDVVEADSPDVSSGMTAKR